MKKLSSVDEARFEIFSKRYRPKNEEQQLSTFKKLDGSFLPPCYRVLKEKIKRTKFISALWSSATLCTPNQLQPAESSGWNLEDGQYKISWFEGDTAPKIIDVTSTEDEVEDEEIELDDFEGTCIVLACKCINLFMLCNKCKYK